MSRPRKDPAEQALDAILHALDALHVDRRLEILGSARRVLERTIPGAQPERPLRRVRKKTTTNGQDELLAEPVGRS